MKIQDLVNDTTANAIVNKILTNQSFKDQCMEKIKLICDDGKVDHNDIPHILALIITLYKTGKTMTIKKDKIKDVLKLLIVRLFEETKLMDTIDPNLLEFTLDSSLTLVVLSLSNDKVKNFFGKIFSCVKSKITEELHDLEDLIYVKKNIKASLNN
jgi:hypothetical protein